jgi:NDP-sugar pyrophosphorylase family protein
MICYPLGWLRDGGIAEVTICGSSATQELRVALGSSARLQMQLDYYVENHPRGPAGCVRDAAITSDAQTFVVVEGSMIPSIDIASLLIAHRNSGALVTTVVEIERRQSRAAQLRLPGGIYVFDREVLARIAASGFQDIKQGLLERLHAERVRVHPLEALGVSPRILDYASYTSASRWIIGSTERRSQFLRDFVPVGEGMHHPTSWVSSSAQLIGPVLLGAGVRVEANAVIVGPTSIGEGSVVGAKALIARSVLLARCFVGEGAHVDSSLLADDVEIGAMGRTIDSVQLGVSGSPSRVKTLARVQSLDAERPIVSVPSIGELLPEGAR